jgi:hypothetical protein
VRVSHRLRAIEARAHEHETVALPNSSVEGDTWREAFAEHLSDLAHGNADV